MLEDPSCLLEKFAGNFDTLATEVHVASTAHQGHSIVVQGGDGCEQG